MKMHQKMKGQWLGAALLAVFVVGLGGSGCTEDEAPPDGTEGEHEPPDCLPSEAVFERTVQGIVEGSCGQCHGETPDFGAPYGLTSYDLLVAGEEGQRPVDRMVQQLVEGTMPPTPYPLPSHDEFDTLIAWASCGEQQPDYQAGLEASAPVMLPASEPPAGVESFDLTASSFDVPVDLLNHYHCFAFTPPIQEDRFVRRFEMVVDESRVLHHLVLFRVSGPENDSADYPCQGMAADAEFLYAWAPGQDAVQFEKGGFRVRPDDHYVVQIHYNNGAGLSEIADSSGVRVYHGPVEGTEYGMMATGPIAFEIPAGETVTVSSQCSFDADVVVLAGMPHMHDYGSEFHQEIVRADGSRESLIDLTGWSFEAQLIYDLSAELGEGDRLITSCVFDNPTNHEVQAGPRTEDEMCFNFMYVTPPPDRVFCDETPPEELGPLGYVAGACAPTPGILAPRLVDGPLQAGAPEPLTGGALRDGLWELVAYELWAPADNSLVNFIDMEQSYVQGRGQMAISGDELAVDLSLRFHGALIQGAAIDSDQQISIAGSMEILEGDGYALLHSDCGLAAGEEQPFRFEETETGLAVQFQAEQQGILLTSRFDFIPADSP